MKKNLFPTRVARGALAACAALSVTFSLTFAAAAAHAATAAPSTQAASS
ncbi:hypothetical protein G3N97_19505, partial [Paraburkholderia sp. Ac-20347]|nr:hypothetical protein [Paraburkholderia sp. Ac-20347]